MTPSRPIILASAPIVGESRAARQAVVLGARMYTAPPNSNPPPRKSDVFRVDPEIRQLREKLDELEVQLAYAFATGLPTGLLVARIENAKTILRGKGEE